MFHSLSGLICGIRSTNVALLPKQIISKNVQWKVFIMLRRTSSIPAISLRIHAFNSSFFRVFVIYILFFFQVTPQNVIRLREVRWTRWSRPISQARNEAPNINYAVLLKPTLPMSANSVEFLESSHSNVLQWLEQLRRRHYQRRTNNFKPETAHHHCAHRVNFTFVNTHDTFRLYTKAGSHLLQICKLLQLRIVCFPRIFPQHFLTSQHQTAFQLNIRKNGY
jgi:hypothetical protein